MNATQAQKLYVRSLTGIERTYGQHCLLAMCQSRKPNGPVGKGQKAVLARLEAMATEAIRIAAFEREQDRLFRDSGEALINPE